MPTAVDKTFEPELEDSEPGEPTEPDPADTGNAARGNNLGGGEIILVDLVGPSAGASNVDSFEFLPSENDLEAPVPPGDIIIMPDPSVPPGVAPHSPTLGWGVGGIESDDGALDGDGAVIFISDSVDMIF